MKGKGTHHAFHLPLISGETFIILRFNGFSSNGKSVNRVPRYKRVFYRLRFEGLEKDAAEDQKGKTVYTIKGGKSFKLSITTICELQELMKRQPQQRTIVFESSNSKIQIVGSPKLVFSKYGSGEIFLRTDKVTHDEDIAITIHSPFDDFRAANITLTIRLGPTHGIEAIRSIPAACLLAVGSMGFVMLSKAMDAKKGVFTFLFDFLAQFMAIPTLMFVVILGLCFYGVFD